MCPFSAKKTKVRRTAAQYVGTWPTQFSSFIRTGNVALPRRQRSDEEYSDRNIFTFNLYRRRMLSDIPDFHSWFCLRMFTRPRDFHGSDTEDFVMLACVVLAQCDIHTDGQTDAHPWT